MKNYLKLMSPIEMFICVAIVLLVAVLVLGGLHVDSAQDLCMFKGGVPIQDANGLLVSCDFPVQVYR